MVGTASSKASYLYAITGSVMVLLAVGAVAAAYTVPFGQMRLQGDEPDERTLIEYGIIGLDVTVRDGDEVMTEDITWREQQREGELATEFKLGHWMVPIGGFLLLAAAIFLLSAPSAGVKPARIGAIVGLGGGLVLAVGAIAFLIGYADSTEAAFENLNPDEHFLTFESRTLRPGMIWLGAGVVLGLGGSVLGFSDKVPTGQVAPKRCQRCSKPMAAHQAFCAACGSAA